MRITLKDLDSLIEAVEDKGGEIIEQLRDFRSEIKPLTPKPITTTSLSDSDEWELIKTYEFNKRTTYIYQSRITGEQKAWDKLKREEE